MKKLLPVMVVLTLFLSCTEDTTNPHREGILEYGKMNLAILVVDYMSYGFEGGNLSFYEPCRDCDSDSLPFAVDFISPGDFGGITFSYTETGDTLFDATIIWLGIGKIYYPQDFEPPNSFHAARNAADKPDDSEYFEYWLHFDKYTMDAKTDSAWAAVDSLEITNEFAGIPSFRVGFYLYTPAVGVFSPQAAKWIIFLYAGVD